MPLLHVTTCDPKPPQAPILTLAANLASQNFILNYPPGAVTLSTATLLAEDYDQRIGKNTGVGVQFCCTYV